MQNLLNIHVLKEKAQFTLLVLANWKSETFERRHLFVWHILSPETSGYGLFLWYYNRLKNTK